jgi:acetyl esterase
MTLPPLDPAIESWLEQLRSWEPPTANERESARLLSDSLFARHGSYDAAAATVVSHHVVAEDRTIRVEEYRPAGREDETLPAYLSLHGGAFRLGDVEELINVGLCSRRSADAGFAVFSVNYRLAPEHPYPAAIEDAVAALTWLIEDAESLRIDPERIVIGGVSAGGDLCAVLALEARDRGLHVCGQLLEVPVVDLRDEAVWLDEYAEINGFSTLAELRGEYCTLEQTQDASLSPLLADLAGLPPTHVMIAQLDPLRGGAEAFVQRLREAGNLTTATLHLGELHGTHGLFRHSRGARVWHAEVVAVLQEFAGAGAS